MNTLELYVTTVTAQMDESGQFVPAGDHYEIVAIEPGGCGDGGDYHSQATTIRYQERADFVRVFNLTPHQLTILDATGTPHVFETFRYNDLYMIARRDTRAHEAPIVIGGIEFSVQATTFGLPHFGFFEKPNDKIPQYTVPLSPSATWPFVPGDVLVVSRLFLDAPEARQWAASNGFRLFAPGELVRDEQGKPVAARGFSE